MRLKSIVRNIIIIVHFKGLKAFWDLFYGNKNILNGKWIKEPDKDFIINLNE